MYLSSAVKSLLFPHRRGHPMLHWVGCEKMGCAAQWEPGSYWGFWPLLFWICQKFSTADCYSPKSLHILFTGSLLWILITHHVFLKGKWVFYGRRSRRLLIVHCISRNASVCFHLKQAGRTFVNCSSPWEADSPGVWCVACGAWRVAQACLHKLSRIFRN